MVSNVNTPVIQKLQGSSREDCIKKLHDRYGNNYEISSWKNIIKTGFLGLFQKSLVEVSFYEKFPSAPVNSVYPQKNVNRNFSENSNVSSVPRSSVDSFIENRNSFLEKTDASVTNVLQIGVISKKIDEMSSQISALVKSTDSKEEHESISKIKELMDENGFTRSYIENMVSRLKSEFSLEDLDNFNLVQRTVVDWIGESINIDRETYVRPPRVIIIVGPTGVGKTTTVAKMAAKIAVDARNNPNVKISPVIRMITIDTMRVAAAEQLSHWAEIIHVNVDKAENANDLQTLYDSYSTSSDYVFIDTSGYSPNDFENIAKMRKILDVKNMHENMYLAVLANINARDLENIIRNYEAFNFRSIIVTKCDETSTYGNLISVLSEKGKKISYLTTGQEVLNTIESANPLYFLKNLRGFNLDMEHLNNKFGSQKNKVEAL